MTGVKILYTLALTNDIMLSYYLLIVNLRGMGCPFTIHFHCSRPSNNNNPVIISIPEEVL